jgi:four helix bundle protein
MDLVTTIYRITALFPREEVYGLTSQLRRAAVSIPSNIAEGQGRRGAVEFRHFLRMAVGSLMELETQVEIAERLAYISREELNRILQEASDLGKVLNGLIASLR